MKKFSNESKISVIGTILFHGLLISLALFLSLGGKPKAPDYVELSFTSFEEPKQVEIVAPTPISKTELKSASPMIKSSTAAAPFKSEAIKTTTVPKISPPRYNLSLEENNIRFPESKLDVSDSRSGNIGVRTETNQGDRRENFSSGKQSDKISGNASSSSSGISSPGSSNIGKELKGFSIAWRDGGKRNKVSGSLPRYPENSNKEVQIKVSVIVSPSGDILQITPLQKADYQFENAVTSALKTWKFEKLGSGLPAENQTGVITFNFKLD